MTSQLRCIALPAQSCHAGKVIVIMTAFRTQNKLGLFAARKIRTSKYPDELRSRQYINLLQEVVVGGGQGGREENGCTVARISGN